MRQGAAVLSTVVALSVGLAGCHGQGGRAASRSGPAPKVSAPLSSATSSTASLAGPSRQFGCALNSQNEAVTGAFGTASAIGWPGNAQAVVTCLGGSFYVEGRFNRTFGFGIYHGEPVTWTNTDGYLPAQITSFQHAGMTVDITEFADDLVINRQQYVTVYARVAVTNPTASPVHADPSPSAGMVPLGNAPVDVPAHGEAQHDYLLAVDNFNTVAPWPSERDLIAAGTFDEHLQHLRQFWNTELSKIAEPSLPDVHLVDAYKSGFIYTQIARSGTHLNTGVNNYQAEFSHDVIGILANLFTQGYDDAAHALLLDARNVVGQQGQYRDGVWTYPWPWAIYLLKTGDLAFVKANFASGSPGATGPSIEAAAHALAADRTGPNGIMGPTDDIDSNGLWTVDNFEALTGLAAYSYLARAVGDTKEAQWSAAQYGSLLAAVNSTLTATVRRFHISYLPCSMVEPNTANRCSNAEDANWAAPFLFGRWAWDAMLLGSPVQGPGIDLLDATYSYGFNRLAGKLPPDTFGGYPSDFYTTAYNAGYGSGALAGTKFRDQGIRSYEFMIANGQSGPYSWWESAAAPASSPWAGTHPGTGQGSSPHAWGIANANKVLLDSLAAQEAGGTLLIGRGIPAAWVGPGQTVALTNFPIAGGRRIDIRITGGDHQITLTLSGAAGASEPVDFELPIFVGNIAGASTGTVLQGSGTVHVPAGQTEVTVGLSHG